MILTNKIYEKALPWLSIIDNMRKQKSYKPILLLSIIKEIDTGKITENQISLSDGMIGTFNEFYEKIGNQQGTGKSYLPFYHLKTDIWDINWKKDSNVMVPSSNTSINKNIEFTAFKNDLFELLMNKDIRNLIKQRLMYKTKEDIQTLDLRNNPSFIVPNDIDFHLKKLFGEIDLPKNVFDDKKPKDLFFRQEKIFQTFLVDHWEEISFFTKNNLEIFGGKSVGVEYNTQDAGRIDILAENSKNESLTVIELKKGSGEPKHIGQILCYLGWARSYFPKKSNINGMLIASDFKSSNKYLRVLKNESVELYSYRLMFDLEKVEFN